MRLKLVIDVDYEVPEEQRAEARVFLENQLRWAADHLAGEGLLSGDGPYDVADWESNVVEP